MGQPSRLLPAARARIRTSVQSLLSYSTIYCTLILASFLLKITSTGLMAGALKIFHALTPSPGH